MQVTQLHAHHQSNEAAITLSGFGSGWIYWQISGSSGSARFQKIESGRSLLICC